MDNKEVYISIVVPIYNVSEYICECMDSLYRQDYKNFEVIFVDDCGTDNSMKKVFHFVKTHTSLRCKIKHHTCNRGLSAARNTGILESEGDYVYFLDSDDWLMPDALSNLVKPLIRKEYDVVAGKVSWSNRKSVGEVKNPLKSFVKNELDVMAWNNLYRRDFLINNEFLFEEGLIHEDIPWTLRIVATSPSLYIIPYITYVYRERPNSIITSMNVERDLTTMLEAFGCIREYIIRYGWKFNKDIYNFVEGKKSAMMYSLLQRGSRDLYEKYYPIYHRLKHISPFKVWFKGKIGMGSLMRDLNYIFPVVIGRIYKQIFYTLVYKLRGKKVVGALWQ